MKKIKIVVLILISCLATACESKYDIIENGVYLTDAQSEKIKKITIDNTGAKTSISSRLGNITNQDVTVHYGTDIQFLSVYNDQHGTNYQILPEKYYSFSSEEAIIKTGSIASNLIDLIIKPYDNDIDVSKKYAIPLSIVHTEGADKIQDSSSLLILIDQIIVTTVPYLNYQTISYIPQEPMTFQYWTLEWMICKEEYKRKFVNQWDIYDTNDKKAIHSKIGDVDAELNQFKVNIRANKPKSITRFVEDKWYHLALTYDGVNIKFYVDGVLDFISPHVAPGEIFYFKEFSFGFGGLRGYINELRVWSVARTQPEIKNNMYIVSPESPGLEIYWKCNDGTGTILHDYTGNNRDGVLSGNVTWKDGIRFPDDGK